MGIENPRVTGSIPVQAIKIWLKIKGLQEIAVPFFRLLAIQSNYLPVFNFFCQIESACR
jgi:hypothetical protein